MIERQVGRLTDLVDDMLDVARLNSGKIVLERRVIDLAEVVRHVLGSFQDAGRSLHLRVDASSGRRWVFADETRLEQIVANLLDNAFKYTPAGGHVRIETGTAADQATLVVADDGSGIAPELLPRIFDVFAQGERTLERAQGGLGLGLTVVRRLVALHGGSIRAESPGPGGGATFSVGLPSAPVGRAKASCRRSRPRRRGASSLVEDNVDNRELMQLLLGLKGHAVTPSATARPAWRRILGEAPEVAIVDIGLPGIDGYEVARRIRHAAPAPPPLLVAVTGYGTPEDRQLALSTGFDAFMVKPFDIDAFERLLREKAAPA